MNFYKIEYRMNEKNEYIYPSGVKEVVWKKSVYDYKNKVMIGFTEQELKADGENIVSFSSKEAVDLIKEIESSYPKIKVSESIFEK